VKTAKVPRASELIRHEIAILKDLNHPLVIRLRESFSGAADRNPFFVTEFVANGSLADHLPGGENGDRCQLRDSTRIVRIISGIVLAMRFLHSRGIVHCALTP
jgi:serine/threonine protein kinase